MDQIIKKAIFYSDPDNKIRKKDIIKAVKFYRNKKYKGIGGNYLELSFEPNFCGFHLTQCYSSPKPCIGCNSQSGGDDVSYNKQMIQKSVKQKLMKKYPKYKITYHALHYLTNLI